MYFNNGVIYMCLLAVSIDYEFLCSNERLGCRAFRSRRNRLHRDVNCDFCRLYTVFNCHFLIRKVSTSHWNRRLDDCSFIPYWHIDSLFSCEISAWLGAVGERETTVYALY